MEREILLLSFQKYKASYQKSAPRRFLPVWPSAMPSQPPHTGFCCLAQALEMLLNVRNVHTFMAGSDATCKPHFFVVSCLLDSLGDDRNFFFFGDALVCRWRTLCSSLKLMEVQLCHLSVWDESLRTTSLSPWKLCWWKKLPGGILCTVLMCTWAAGGDFRVTGSVCRGRGSWRVGDSHFPSPWTSKHTWVKHCATPSQPLFSEKLDWKVVYAFFSVGTFIFLWKKKKKK